MGGKITRRTFLAAGCGIAANGCSAIPVVNSALEVAKLGIVGQPDLPLKREAISKLPYASMTARVGKSQQALFILGFSRGADQHWVTASGQSLVLRGGRLVKTAGLGDDLLFTRALGGDPVDGQLHREGVPPKFSRIVDAGDSHGLIVDSEFKIIGGEKIMIVEIELRTVLVRERNVARTNNWDFDNYYWIDPGDGFVWKSEQVFARNVPPVRYEILKPAA